MKEITSEEKQFILHWGEMGTRWGINRTVAQVHALLFISEHPLNAEDICGALKVARSNVSNSLKELQNWGIVKVVHLEGDRRDHFESIKDVYDMFRVILAERKRREIDPTLAVLRECAKTNEEAPTYAQARMNDLREFFETGAKAYDQLSELPTSTVVRAMKTSDKLLKALNLFS